MKDIDPLTLMLVCDSAHTLCMLKERAGSTDADLYLYDIETMWQARISFFKRDDNSCARVMMYDNEDEIQLPNFAESEGSDWNEALHKLAELISYQISMYKGVVDGNIVEKNGKFFKLVEIED